MPVSEPQSERSRLERPARAQAKQRRIDWILIATVLVLYCYPAVRTRMELRSASLPPMFRPDLSLYLNLSAGHAPNDRFVNPYYLVMVPWGGAGYLKFHLAPAMFGTVLNLFRGRLWISVFVWNLLWWTLLCVLALYFFRRYLPNASGILPGLGVLILLLFNFGVAKDVVRAWMQLPSMAAFNAVSLPFMRAFIPIIPAVLLLCYVGLQMEVLRRQPARQILAAMGVIQFAALLIFPYATLMMAGVTAVSAGWWIYSQKNYRTLGAMAVYGAVCVIADSAYTLRGSLSFYSERTSMIQFQPSLIPHLVGGNCVILAGLTIATIFSARLVGEVKWPLVGLGATNLALLLGDAVIPAKTILLSHHAGHFIHETIAILSTFLLSVFFGQFGARSWRGAVAAGAVSLMVTNGLLLAMGAYRAFLPFNRSVAALADVFSKGLKPQPHDLVIAPSRNVDDTCGWVFLLTGNPVLYCTDAEVMLTPQQNLQVHRFRQAVYLYLSGMDSADVQRRLSGEHSRRFLYALGYWAEAASPSTTDQVEGIERVERELLPALSRVETDDSAVQNFFRGYSRVVVIDDASQPVFSESRLRSMLVQESQQESGPYLVRIFSPHGDMTGSPGAAR